MSLPGSNLAVVVAIAGLTFGMPVLAGAPPEDVLLYAGYVFAYLLVPGWLLYMAFGGGGGAVRQALFAWALGVCLELALFNLTAALDAREALYAPAPLLAAALLAASRVRARAAAALAAHRRTLRAPAGRFGLALVVLVAIAGIYLNLEFFSQTPAPDVAGGVAYHEDVAYHLSLAAEASNHWPIENPAIAGEPLRYHLFAHMQMAASHQVTGIEFDLIVRRLAPLLPTLMVLLGLVAIGGSLFSSRAAGLGAVALLVLAGEPDLDPTRIIAFTDGLFANLWLSPTLLLSLPLTFAAVIVAAEWIERGGGRPQLALLIPLLIAAGGAKATALPVLICGLGLLVLWLWRDRARRDRALAVLGVAVVCFAGVWLALYSGAENNGFTLFVGQAVSVSVFAPWADGDAARAALVPALLIALLLPLAGLGYHWRATERSGTGDRLAVCLLVPALGAFVALGHVGISQSFALWPAYLIALVPAAAGVIAAARAIPATAQRPLALALGVVALACVLGAVRLSLPDEGVPPGSTVAAAGVALAIAILAAAAVAHARPVIPVTAAATLAVLVVSGFDSPLDYGGRAKRIAVDEVVYSTPSGENFGVVPGTVDAMRWLRDNSDPDDLFAVDNHRGALETERSRYFNYSAFSERRAFLEAWDYGTGAESRVEVIQPFAERLAVNDAAFEGSSEAISRLRDQEGVAWMVHDKRLAPEAAELSELLPPAFENEAISIHATDDLAG